ASRCHAPGGRRRMRPGAPGTRIRRFALACAVVAIGALATGAFAASASVSAPAWSLLPMPAMVKQAGTGTVDIGDGAGVAGRGPHDAALAAVVDNFIQRVASVRGLTMHKVASGGASAAVTFDVRPDALVEGEEGYAIAVDKQGILVTARTARGAFYGSVTVW